MIPVIPDAQEGSPAEDPEDHEVDPVAEVVAVPAVILATGDPVALPTIAVGAIDPVRAGTAVRR